MPNIAINHTVEDYLRAAYRVTEREGSLSNRSLASELGISGSAVSEMLHRLDEAGLVRYRRYRAPEMTEQGLELALAVTRRHRLWEVFLIEHLGFSWDQVHEIAEELEHIRSDDLVDRLDAFLGRPSHDPHGDPIPKANGEMPRRELVPIAQMRPQQRGVVARVADERAELLRYAESVGLSIGAEVRVIERVEFDGSVRLALCDRESVISEKLAESVSIELIDPNS